MFDRDIRKKWHRFIQDPRGEIAFRTDEIKISLNEQFWSLCMQWSAWWWGVSLGKRVRFIGKTHLKRSPGSTICIGEDCRFRSDYRSNPIGLNRPCYLSTLSPTAEITISNKCGFSATILAAFERIQIGDNVLFGANTTITDFDWHGKDARIRKMRGDDFSAPVSIGNNVWLGLNVVVLKGVTIGENSIIGANSLVTRSIPANVIAGGVPAKVIRAL